MSVVGSAYVVIRAISPALKKDISKAASDGVKAATPSIEAAGKKIQESMGDSVKDAAKKAGKAAAPSAKSAGMHIGEAMADAMPGSFLGRAGPGLKRSMRRLIDKAGPDKEGNNLGVRLSKGFGSAVSKFKVPMPIWLGFLGVPAIGGALKILSAYVAGAISLVSAMGPAFAAAGAAGLASFLALGGAAGAVMMALKTASPMLDRFKVAASVVKDEFKVVGLSVQKALLPNLAKAMGLMTGTIPVLKVGLTGLGDAVGQVAVKLAKVTTNAGFLRDLSVVLAQGAPQVKNYGSALGSVLRIVMILASAAAPLATQFSKFVAQFFKGAEGAALAGQESGRLAAFMERAGKVAAQLGGIVGNLGRGLWNVFTAGSESGKSLLDGISALMQKFADWSGSLQGQSQLKLFFDNALPVIREVNGLIGDVLKAVVQPIAQGDNGGVLTFVRAMRTDMLPALQEVGQAASAMGPGLTTLVVSIADLVSAMANSGALGAFTSTLTVMIDALTRLLSLPVVGELAGYALAFGGMAKAVDLVLKPFGGLATAAGPVGKLLFGTSEKAGLLSKAAGPLGKVLPIIAGGLRAVGAAVYTALGPVGLIIAGVVALVAGLIYAYKHSETFRNIVNRLGEAIMNGLGAALEWLKGIWDTVWGGLQAGWAAVQDAFNAGVAAVGSAIDTIRATIARVWDGIQSAFSAGVDFVQGILSRFSGVFDAITQPFQGLAQYFTGVWQVISGIFTGNLDKITTGIANMIGGAVRFFFGFPARVIGALVSFAPVVGGFILNAMTSFGTWVNNGITAMVNWFRSLPGRAYAAIVGLIARIRAWATNMWNIARAAFTSGINAVVSFARALPGRVMAGIQSLIARIRSWATTTWNNVRNAFVTGVNNAVNFARQLPGRVVSAVQSLAGRLRTTATTAWNNLRTAFTTGINNAVTLARGLPGRIVSAVGNLGSRLMSAGRDLIAGFQAGITARLGALLQTARDLAGKVTAAVRNALKIKSPSRVFMEIGKFTGQGLVDGMKAMTKPVGLAGRNMAIAAIPDIPAVGSPGGPGATSIPGGAGAATIVSVDMNVSVDDLAKMATVSDFMDMLQNARVNTRKTLRSGTVTA